MSEFSWDSLIMRIEDGDVVPVIGQDVLQVEIGPENDKKKVMLYTYLAQQLAAKLDVPFDAKNANPLNAVALAYMEEDPEHEIDDVDRQLRRLVKETAALPVPEPPRQLAEIRRLNLFLTTTFDSMMQRALDEVRTRPGTAIGSFTPDRIEDITPQMIESG